MFFSANAPLNEHSTVFTELLWNSVLTAAWGTVSACVLGFGAALFALGASPRVRATAILAAVMVLVLPPFLVVNSWLHFLGFAGPWRAWWPFDIYSLTGVIWNYALTFWPISFILCLASWQKLDAVLFEVEPALRGTRLVQWLLWPSARGALVCAALITFALQINQFAVPTILQVKVLPAELWLRLSTQLDLTGAMKAALPAITVTLLLLFALRGREVSWPRLRGGLVASVVRRQSAGLWLMCAAVFGTLMLTSVGLPIGQLIVDSNTWRDLPKVIRAAPALVTHSFLFAATGAAVAAALGLLVWKIPAGVVGWLLFVTPGVLLGASLPLVLPTGLLAVIIALGLRYFAVSWTGTRLALLGSDHALLDVVRMESSSRTALLRYGYWPQVRSAVALSGYVCYVLALWDIETLILLYPPGGETLAIRIFNLLHYGHIGQVNALCLILLVLALAPCAVWSCSRWLARCGT